MSIIYIAIFTFGHETFKGWTSLSTIDIPYPVNTIDMSAFADCTNLSSVSIPHSVREIGDGAFRNCTNLSEIYCLRTAPPIINKTTFDDPNPATLYVPAGSEDSYRYSDWYLFSTILGIDPTGINKTGMDRETVPLEYYGQDGLKLSNPQHGINIVRMNDGTTRKIYVE